jgi:drug/metabolite transporter (DMT)-like permease
LRSLVAAALVYAWMRWKGLPVFSSEGVLGHAVAVGLLFGGEFGCLYLGLQYTLASRTSILLYTHPFFVAIGAHLFLHGDRLHGRKAVGLTLAFLGIVVLFGQGSGGWSLRTLAGDLLIVLGAALWAATTLYIKRFLTGRAAPIQNLFYQLAFSAPLLFVWSALQEGQPVRGLSPLVAASLAYQCVIVAFVSYLAWFELIHRYNVSVLAAFTFFTPVLGVALSAMLLPDEALRPALVAALVLVCSGMVLVNWPARTVTGDS